MPQKKQVQKSDPSPSEAAAPVNSETDISSEAISNKRPREDSDSDAATSKRAKNETTAPEEVFFIFQTISIK